MRVPNVPPTHSHDNNRDSIRQALFLPGTPLPAIQMLMSYFAEDAEIVYLATGAVLKGKAQIMDLLKRTGSSTYSFDANANEIVNQVTGNDLVSGKKTMYETVIFTLVHDQPISWLLPDVKPTRKRITVPMVGWKEGRIYSWKSR